jgi:hypothetical protein
MAAANCSPAVASRRAKYDDDIRASTLSVHNHSIIPRVLRQRDKHNIYKTAGPEEERKLAHRRIQSAITAEHALELIQTEMAQKTMLRAKMYSARISRESKSEESCGVGGRAMRSMDWGGVGECGSGRHSCGVA